MNKAYTAWKPWSSTWPRFDRQDTYPTLMSLPSLRLAILDTETDGLVKTSQITEITLVDYNSGEILMNTLVRPRGIEESFNQTKASQLTGITYELLMQPTVPTFADVMPVLIPILRSYTIGGWNSDFDSKMVMRSAFQWGKALHIPQFHTLDVMKLFQTFIGFSDWSTLSEALDFVGLSEPVDAHRSLQDVYSTMAILQAMQSYMENTEGAQ